MRTLLLFDRFGADRGILAVVVVAPLGLAVVAGVDFATGSELSLSLFYLGPVSLVAWRAGTRGGVGASVAAAATWFLADRLGGYVYSHPLIPLWNALVRLGFFVVVTLLLGALAASMARERSLARTDALTGLLNRLAFEEVAHRELERSLRNGTPLTFGYIDLDGFKQINDRLGHAAGDAVLRTVAQVMGEQLRTVDATARLGGDEFAVLLPDTSLDAARHAIGRLSAGFAAAGVACSVGALVFTTPPESVAGALDAVDAVMYRAKSDAERRVLVTEAEATQHAAA